MRILLRIAAISLVDKERQSFKSRIGLDMAETARAFSFCAHAIESQQTFVVRDAADRSFFDNPLVIAGPKIKFYAGEPLRNSAGFLIGTLCVMANEPREFDEEDQKSLQDLARVVELALDNRKLKETQYALLNSLVEADRDKRVDPLTGIWNRRGLDERFDREVARVTRENIPLAVGMADIDYSKRVNNQPRLAPHRETLRAAASHVPCAQAFERIGADRGRA